MRLTFKHTSIPDCYVLNPEVHRDERGSFVKTFHSQAFTEAGLVTGFSEEYYSVSRQGVLRGLHFQLPPVQHVKIVYCVCGEILDVVVDLRTGSPTFGKFQSFALNADNPKLIYVPPGLAHGFYVTSPEAVVMYKVSTIYSPEHDTGVRWDSVGIPWPDKDPILSPRDRAFVAFSDFVSPFRYGPSVAEEMRCER